MRDKIEIKPMVQIFQWNCIFNVTNVEDVEIRAHAHTHTHSIEPDSHYAIVECAADELIVYMAFCPYVCCMLIVAAEKTSQFM